MKNIDSQGHVTGKSIYLEDIALITGTLHGVPFDSPVAHAKILSVDYSKALAMKGVHDIITYKDVPGANQIGGIFPDEELFAEEEVHFCGMPIALVIADSDFNAREAIKLIDIEFKEKEIVTDPRVAREKGDLIFPPRTFKLGDTSNAWADCEHVF